MRRLHIFSRVSAATLITLVLSVALGFSYFTIFENWGGIVDWSLNTSSSHASLAQDATTSCSRKGKVAGTYASANSTPASPSFDYYDQMHFKQPLHADCPHHGPRHGLFHPDTPHPRYIITGGAGFIGSHLVKALRTEGVHVSQLKVVDNLWRGRLANLQYPNGSWAINATADFCALDLRHEEDTLRYIRGADVIYHLAGVVPGVAYDVEHQKSVFQDNLLINTHTLKAAKENGIANYIYAGAACSLPKGLKDGPGIQALREGQTYPVEPESAYGWSKLMGEYEAVMAQDIGVFNVGLLRFPNVYGPCSDYSKTSSQAIPSLIRKALNYPQEPYYVARGSKNQYRDFVFIDDIVRALLLVKDRGMNMGVIQLGSKTVTTLRALAIRIADLVGERFNKTIAVEFDTCELEGDQGCVAVGERANTILGWEPQVPLAEGLLKTIDWLGEDFGDHKEPSVLVILIGQARGSEYAWKSMLRHLVKPYKAHLATFFTDASSQTLLQQHAQFTWSTPEVADWGVHFDQAAQLCKDKNDEHSGLTDWRSLCDVKNQWLGGIANCGHPGSSGILLSFRWLVAQKLLSLNLLKQYDYFVLSRADFLYLCDHIPFAELDPLQGHVPFGEEYGGYTDRHLVGSPEMFYGMINITQQLVCETAHFEEVVRRDHPWANLESIQRRVWENLTIPIQQYNRSFFAVKLPDDPTKWAQGSQHEAVSKFDGLLVKYQGELDQAMAQCHVENSQDLEDNLTIIKDMNGERRLKATRQPQSCISC